MKKLIILQLLLIMSIFSFSQTFDTTFFYKNVKIQNKDLVVDTVKLRYGILYSDGSYQVVAFLPSNYYTKTNINDTLTAYETVSHLIGHYYNIGDINDTLDYYLRSNNDTVTNLAVGDSLIKFNMGNNSIIYFKDTSNIFIGNYAVVPNPTGKNNILVGVNTGKRLSTGERNILVGRYAGDSLTIGNKVVIIGDDAVVHGDSIQSSTIIGTGAGHNLDSRLGQTNTIIGYGSSVNLLKGYENLQTGSYTGFAKNGYRNTILGEYANSDDLAVDGDSNVFVGWYSARYNHGSRNTFLGSQTGYDNVTGSGNVFIGNRAGASETGSNLLYIDNSNVATPLIYGNFATNRLYVNNWLNTDTLQNDDSLLIMIASYKFSFKDGVFKVGSDGAGSLYTGSVTFQDAGNITDNAYGSINITDSDTTMIISNSNDSILLIPGDTGLIKSNGRIINLDQTVLADSVKSTYFGGRSDFTLGKSGEDVTINADTIKGSSYWKGEFTSDSVGINSDLLDLGVHTSKFILKPDNTVGSLLLRNNPISSFYKPSMILNVDGDSVSKVLLTDKNRITQLGTTGKSLTTLASQKYWFYNSNNSFDHDHPLYTSAIAIDTVGNVNIKGSLNIINPSLSSEDMEVSILQDGDTTEYNNSNTNGIHKFNKRVDFSSSGFRLSDGKIINDSLDYKQFTDNALNYGVHVLTCKDNYLTSLIGGYASLVYAGDDIIADANLYLDGTTPNHTWYSNEIQYGTGGLGMVESYVRNKSVTSDATGLFWGHYHEIKPSLNGTSNLLYRGGAYAIKVVNASASYITPNTEEGSTFPILFSVQNNDQYNFTVDYKGRTSSKELCLRKKSGDYGFNYNATTSPILWDLSVSDTYDTISYDLQSTATLNYFKEKIHTVGNLCANGIGGIGTYSPLANSFTVKQPNFLVTQEVTPSGTDSSISVLFLSGQPIIRLNGVDGDQIQETINTSDQALFQNASGGYIFDYSITSTKCDTISSTATITLGNSNNFVISGTADVDSINTASTIQNWSVIYIEFSGDAATNGLVDGKNLRLSTSLVYTTNDMICLQRRGNYFYEVSRSIN